MRDNKDIQFKYEKSKDGQSSTSATSDNKVVTMTTTKDKEIHETRHGGQYSRGEVFKSGQEVKNYGVIEEVDAYKAQYAFDGVLKYNSHNFDQTGVLNRLVLDSGNFPEDSKRTINNINLINATTVNNMGVIGPYMPPFVIPAYPPGNMTQSDFDNN